jgi:hypothetical protein
VMDLVGPPYEGAAHPIHTSLPLNSPSWRPVCA